MTTLRSFAEYNSRFREFINASNPDAAGFNQLALALFALQFAHVEPYRRLCLARRATPDKVIRWTEIPAIPTAAFKEFEVTSLSVEERTAVFHSSGSTLQQPSRHYHNAESLAIYEASLIPWFKVHLLPNPAPGGSNPNGVPLTRPPATLSPPGWERDEASSVQEKFGVVVLTPSPALAPHSSLAHMFGTVVRELGSPDSLFVGASHEPFTRSGVPAERRDSWEQQRAALCRVAATPGFMERTGDDGAWSLDFTAALSAMRRASDAEQPVALLGTAFSFVHLLDRLMAEDIRFDLPPGSRAMETGGYKGRSRSLPRAELHALITRRLAIPASHIVCEYGMSELGSQAYDWQVGNGESETRTERGVFRFPRWARARIVSPETGREVAEGETGLIQVHDLANVRSVLAIQTEDLGVRRGDGFELIGRASFAEPRGCSLMSL